MTIAAITLDDREFAVACEGRVLSVDRSIVARGEAARSEAARGEAARGEAQRGARADELLRLRPTEVSTRHWHDLAVLARAEPDDMALCAAELRRHLETIARAHERTGNRNSDGSDNRNSDGSGNSDGEQPDAMWLVVPALYTPQALGSVLGLARALDAPVAGFVDAAVAAVAPLALDRPAIVIEMGLHGLAATLIESGEAVRRRRAVRGTRAGYLELYSSWLDLASGIMVNQTRFDPLHDADTEQRLYDELPRAVAEAQTLGSAKLALDDREGRRCEIVVARDQFVSAATPVLDELDRLLRDLRPAETSLAFVMSAEVAALPGVRERLRNHGSGLLVALPPGWSAAAVSQLALPGTEAGTVRLLRRLAQDAMQPPSDLEVSREPLASAAPSGPPASHIVHGGRAWPLSRAGITVGREGNDAAIALPDGLAGVSRRHCTLWREGDAVVLVDHSRHGTWLNGERVTGRASVQPGDRLRIGDPGVELALILVGAGDAQVTPQH